jgi:hypothetical protein
MEVHHHSHSSRKKWTHYFWEFLMLFLAMFCGFLAENQREHMIEHGREKVYMTSLVENLQEDTSWLIFALNRNDYLVKGGDTLRQTIYDVGVKDSAVKKLYVYSRQYLRPLSFEYTDRTSSQLKNSGAMRLIRKKKVADGIVNYWSNCQTTVFLHERYLFFLNKAGDFRNKILDSRYFCDADYELEVFPVKDNPVLLYDDAKLISEYANLVFLVQQIQRQAIKNNYTAQLKNAVDLINVIREEFT